MKQSLKQLSFLVLLLLCSTAWSLEIPNASHSLQLGVIAKQSLNVKLLSSVRVGKQVKDIYVIKVKSNSPQIKWEVKAGSSGKSVMNGQRGQFEQKVEWVHPAKDDGNPNFYLATNV